ncbi:HlyD family secretion protein [Desulfotalea psychrophila]|uniref:Related to multidrug resistance protein K n=1 Tax=Desulfotalea psychrophila (strain LSv54 / DSM 12343) TaxID=177439 RepID=Q6ARZ2_DESPS|nr:HlyD family efflux transporter periplasmic adaptor subunit [Desulfotalea psychrophila]CAG34883.1 related to multidrug resistance protein K [Desulfotalea psychrophila LSv54]
MPTTSQENKPKRNLLIAIFLIAIAIGIVIWIFLSQRQQESTDDAYVIGNTIIISSKIAGTVQKISVSNTEFVDQQQILIELEQNDLLIQEKIAEANLTRIVRTVKSQYLTTGQLKDNIRATDFKIAELEADLARRAGGDLDGTVTLENLQHMGQAIKIARAQRDSARQGLEAKQTIFPGEELQNNPEIKLATAHLQEIYLARINSTIIAPMHGLIANRSIQAGERISPGQPLMAVIPLDNVWVVANFKETQLGDIRIGQAVELISDIYGKKLPFEGIIAGIGAGTGSAFSAIPAENATGNWIKIVQRVPVKIFISPDQIKKHPLRIGMSMTVRVDTKDQEEKSFQHIQQHDDISAIYQSHRQLAEQQARDFLNTLLIHNNK